MGQWYYSTNGQQAGPVELDQLRGLIASGQVRPADMVWREGMPTWQPASTIPELSAPAAQPAQEDPRTSRRWHYTAAGQQAGPVETEQLKAMIAAGQVSRGDLVWSEGMPNWVPASSVPELAGQAGAATLEYGGQTAYGTMNYYSGSGAISNAGFWLRAGAWIIDWLIVNVPFFILGFLLGITAGRMGPNADSAQAGLSLLLNLSNIVAMWLYFALQESSARQATVGKRVCGIRVTDMQGQRISFGRATGRHFGKILSGLICLIGFIMAGFTERNQGLHDMIAGTLVVRD